MTSDPVSTPQNMLHLQRHLHLAMSVIWWFDFQTSFSPGVTCCDMLKCMARIGRYALTGHHTWFVVFRSWFPVLGIVHVSYIFFQKSITPLPVSIDTDPGGGGGHGLRSDGPGVLSWLFRPQPIKLPTARKWYPGKLPDPQSRYKRTP